VRCWCARSRKKASATRQIKGKDPPIWFRHLHGADGGGGEGDRGGCSSPVIGTAIMEPWYLVNLISLQSGTRPGLHGGPSNYKTSASVSTTAAASIQPGRGSINYGWLMPRARASATVDWILFPMSSRDHSSERSSVCCRTKSMAAFSSSGGYL